MNFMSPSFHDPLSSLIVLIYPNIHPFQLILPLPGQYSITLINKYNHSILILTPPHPPLILFNKI